MPGPYLADATPRRAPFPWSPCLTEGSLWEVPCSRPRSSHPRPRRAAAPARASGPSCPPVARAGTRSWRSGRRGGHLGTAVREDPVREDPWPTPGPDGGTPGRPSGWLWRAHRLTVGVLSTLYVVVALLGALGAGLLVMAVMVPAGGLLGAVVARGVHRTLHPGQDAPFSIHLPVAVRTALFSPFVIGMDSLGEDSVYVLVVLTILCTVASAGWTHGLEPEAAGPRPQAPSQLSDAELASVRHLLGALSVEELLHEWRWSRRRLRTDPHQAVQLRDLLLEELQQRDPAGFRAWLRDGLEQDPGCHIRGDGAGGATTDRPR